MISNAATKDRLAASAASDMLDLAACRTDRKLLKVESAPDALVLRWDDGRESRFHAVWLRDNCPCPACRHPYAKERRFLLIDSPGDITIASAGLTNEGDLLVRFTPERPDGEIHASRFAAAWLRQRDYSEAARGERVHMPRLWGVEMAGRLPTFDYAAIMNSKAGLRDWLEVLRDWGVALVKGAPSEDGEVRRVAERIGALRATNFGTVYDVVTAANPNASADTEMALEPHTDLANWRWPTDFQFLFCLANDAVGGSSILVDGFRVAEELRHREPDAFEILTTRPIDFRFHDESCDIRHRAPTIELDGNGRVTRVRFNNWLRDTLDLPEQDIERTYGALRVIWRYLRDPAFQIHHRLEAGCMLSMDNNRVLHGRDAFDRNTGRRHFQGCYVDRDLLLSRLRLLDR